MHYTRLGGTGLVVSRIGLGCMSYGSSRWRPWVLEEDAAQPFFRRAVEQGITFFDTADMYSAGAREEVTGLPPPGGDEREVGRGERGSYDRD